MTASAIEGPRSKRSAIIEVAIDHFGRDGYELTRWATIAEEVGIGQTALYHYFESKGHCLLTIMRLELESSLARLDEARASGLDASETFATAVQTAYSGGPRDALARRILQSHMDILSTPRPSEKEEEERRHCRALAEAVETQWREMIEAGVAAGQFSASDSQMSARVVLSILVGVWRWYRPGGSLSLDEVASMVSEAAMRVVEAR